MEYLSARLDKQGKTMITCGICRKRIHKGTSASFYTGRNNALKVAHPTCCKHGVS